MEFSIKIVKKGSMLLEIGAKGFMDFINQIIQEKAFIKMQKEITLDEEEKWLAKTAEELDKGKKIFVLALSGKRIVGNCQAYVGDGALAYNMNFGLAVSKNLRGQGLGRKLLLTAIEEGKKTFSPHKIMIDYIGGNETAKHLYESIGFREVCRLKGFYHHYGEFRDKVTLELAES
jgi:RimJ/RimL family protein N-acetyltransferase